MIIAALAKLATHPSFQPTGDLTPAQFESMAVDFVNDLSEFGMSEIESAIIAYRQDPRAKGFPTPGRLRDLASRARAERAEVNKPKVRPQFGGSRPSMWWCKPKDQWFAGWLESEVPYGQKIRDTLGAPLRDPEGIAF